MPIVISRKGTILQATAPTQEQQDKAWEALVRNWARKHPDLLKQPQAEAMSSQTAACDTFPARAV